MSKSRLITASLISSINWAKTCPASWKKKAWLDLENQLTRAPFTMSPEAQQGIDFEKEVYRRMLRGETDKGSEEFQLIVKTCIGGKVQQKHKRYLGIDIYEYCLYGKFDIEFEDRILDIKTTKKFKNYTYTKSFQHLLYMYIKELYDFYYIIAEWDDYPKIKQVVTIPILNQSPVDIEIEVLSTITEAMEFLESYATLWDAYNNKFCLY